MYLEDIFYLYERNKLIYSDFPDIEIVQPLTIGDIDVPFNKNKKCYTYSTEICPICIENIGFTKINTYITDCGHTFHRKCLFEMMDSKWKIKPFSTLRCPMCRCNLGYPDLYVRYYTCLYHIKDNPFFYSDELENFWITKDFINPQYCKNIQNPHYLGMKKDCDKCKDYCKNG
jgi:hypothetical protein